MRHLPFVACLLALAATAAAADIDTLEIDCIGAGPNMIGVQIDADVGGPAVVWTPYRNRQSQTGTTTPALATGTLGISGATLSGRLTATVVVPRENGGPPLATIPIDITVNATVSGELVAGTWSMADGTSGPLVGFRRSLPDPMTATAGQLAMVAAYPTGGLLGLGLSGSTHRLNAELDLTAGVVTSARLTAGGVRASHYPSSVWRNNRWIDAWGRELRYSADGNGDLVLYRVSGGVTGGQLRVVLDGGYGIAPDIQPAVWTCTLNRAGTLWYGTWSMVASGLSPSTASEVVVGRLGRAGDRIDRLSPVPGDARSILLRHALALSDHMAIAGFQDTVLSNATNGTGNKQYDNTPNNTYAGIMTGLLINRLSDDPKQRAIGMQIARRTAAWARMSRGGVMRFGEYYKGMVWVTAWAGLGFDELSKAESTPAWNTLTSDMANSLRAIQQKFRLDPDGVWRRITDPTEAAASPWVAWTWYEEDINQYGHSNERSDRTYDNRALNGGDLLLAMSRTGARSGVDVTAAATAANVWLKEGLNTNPWNFYAQRRGPDDNPYEAMGCVCWLQWLVEQPSPDLALIAQLRTQIESYYAQTTGDKLLLNYAPRWAPGDPGQTGDLAISARYAAILARLWTITGDATARTRAEGLITAILAKASPDSGMIDYRGRNLPADPDALGAADSHAYVCMKAAIAWELLNAIETLETVAGNTAPTISAIPNQNRSEGGGPVTVNFTIGDGQTPADELGLGRAVSDWGVLPLSALTFGGSGANRTLTITPPVDASGTATVTITVTDGQGAKASRTFTVAIAGSNDVPVAGSWNLTTDLNTGLAVRLYGNDADGDALTYAIVTPPAHGTLSGGAPFLTYTPTAGYSGTDAFTYTVNDGVATSAPATVAITVKAFNQPPVIGAVPAQSMPEDGTLVVPFSVGDSETPANLLAVNAVSSAGGIVPAGGITLGGSGVNRTVTIRPNANANGNLTITLSAVDEVGARTTRAFSLTVTPVNDAPYVTAAITDKTATVGTPFSFTAAANVFTDREGSAMTWSAAGMPPGVTFTAGTRVFAGTPTAAGQYAVTVSASDGSLTGSDMFLINVAPNVTNTAPTISGIAATTIVEDAVAGPLAFTVGDAETAAGSLIVSVGTSNATLLPTSAITIGGSGANRTVTLTPLADKSGTATVSLTVHDGNLTATTSFVLTVTALNDAPRLVRPVPDLQGEVGSAFTASFDGALHFFEPDGNQVGFACSGLPPGIAFDGPSRTWSGTPTAVGSFTMTLTCNDRNVTPSLTVQDTIVFTVIPANASPTISTPADVTVAEDTPTAAIAVTIGDSETAASALVLTVEGSNPVLTPPSALTLGGSGANRTLVVAPAADVFGTSVITLTVTDAIGQATTASFTLTVGAVNDAPVLALPQADQAGSTGSAFSMVLPAGMFTDVDNASVDMTVTGLPPGLSFTAGTRTIAGTPTTPGTYTVSISGSDGLLSAADSVAFVIGGGGGANQPPLISGASAAPATVVIP